MKEIDNSKDIMRQLTRIYDALNEHFWENELPEVIITFSPKKGSLGHMTGSEVWTSDIADNKYELNISAYYMNRPPVEIAGTILHEQCHLYCQLKGIKECSNSGRYHNKKFMNVAESHGLFCCRTESFGWSDTSFKEESVRFFNSLKIKEFAYRYTGMSGKNNLRRLSCPKCSDTVVWVSSDQYVLCGKCKVPLEYSQAKKDSQSK